MALGHRLKEIIVDGSKACGLDYHGKVWCWSEPDEAAKPVENKEKVVRLGSNQDHAFFAIDQTGAVWGWSSQIYAAVTYQMSLFKLTEAAPFLIDFASVSPFVTSDGEDNSICALDREGAPWCWGWWYYGPQNHYDLRGTPSAVFTELRFKSINVGDGHACALDADGQAWCWGRGSDGQLGCKGPDCGHPLNKVRQRGVKYLSINAVLNRTYAIDTEGRRWKWGGGPSWPEPALDEDGR